MLLFNFLSVNLHKVYELKTVEKLIFLNIMHTGWWANSCSKFSINDWWYFFKSWNQPL